MINTRDDLDSIIGTPEYDNFIRLLLGSIWRIEKNTTTNQWEVIEDTTIIERFGFSKQDFPGITPPMIPSLDVTSLKNDEIKQRTLKYKSDIKDIQVSWISASILDGEQEINKKEQIRQDLLDLKTEYNNDILMIKSKYSN